MRIAHVDPPEQLGAFRLRAIGGGSLAGASLFRSCELMNLSSTDAEFMVQELGIRAVYDVRNRWEVAAHPEPYLIGAKTVALEPSTERRRKDAATRLTAGVIGEYGAPEARMKENYRRYVLDYPILGKAARSIAADGVPALIHCVNGKDRTGVLSAILLRVSGAHADDIMADYLATNVVNAEAIEAEFGQLSQGMGVGERAVLLSFLEARPAYLQIFFDEVDARYGSFDTFVAQELRLTPHQCNAITVLVRR